MVNLAAVPIASLVVSLTAVCVALVALWKSHFATFTPLATSGPVTFRIFDFSKETETWFMRSYAVAIAITNGGARPGVVEALRLRLYHEGAAAFEEFIPSVFELEQSKTWRRGGDRDYWIDEAIVGDAMPFVVLPKTTVLKYMAFERAGAERFIREQFAIDLQLQIAGKWRHAATWTTACDEVMWNSVVGGHAILTITKDAHIFWRTKRS